ncbi:MAG TPA: GNAT family N-acetyltransferase [Rhizomicrobium sp.]|jgi:ribosomal protein S18 acetylase RimI-like enzyme
MSIIVSRMAPDDAALLRELRLEALAAHPAYLAADPDYEASWPIERWRAGLAKAHWFLARSDDAVAGICVFTYPAHNKKQKHTGHVGSMYVRDAFKGKGVGDALLQALLEHAVTCVEQVALTVTAENARAIRFYERFGFREYGRIPRSILHDGRYYDDLEMIRPVSASD